MVTHDVEEAVLLSDRILVMSHGPAARIVDEVAMPFPPPREQTVLRTEQGFHALVARLLAQLTAPT
jgi:nitrate/nitrite transport system ATP-binding protein